MADERSQFINELCHRERGEKLCVLCGKSFCLLTYFSEDSPTTHLLQFLKSYKPSPPNLRCG